MTRPERARPAHRRTCAGLTLIEVLAAVAVLGVGYVTVIQAGSEGLLREGETRRYLEASLIADRELFQLEEAIDAGTIPRSDAHEVEAYEVEIEVAPVSLAVPPPERGAPVEARVDGASLLGGTRPDQSPLRRIDIRVKWQEGFSERAVSRTTFAFDALQAAPILDRLVGSLEAPGGEQGSQPQ